MKPRLVLGIGSPFGADRLGWDAVERLRDLLEVQPLPDDLELQSVDRPGPALIALIEGRRHVILVDAVVSGAGPGTVHHIEGEALFDYRGGLSSHGLGIREALALAQTLGALPPRIELFGLEVEPDNPADASALATLVERIADHLANG